MREIKFRNWLADSKRMHYWGMTGPNEWTAPRSMGVDAQQYTGLKDRNGKEIYEGCRVGYGPDDPSKGVIVWGPARWIIKYDTQSINSAPCDFTPEDARQCEIIGNIYEQE